MGRERADGVPGCESGECISLTDPELKELSMPDPTREAAEEGRLQGRAPSSCAIDEKWPLSE